MNRTKPSPRGVSVILVILIVVALISACSGSKQPEAQKQSSGALSAAQIPQAILSKQSHSAAPQPAAGQAQPPAVQPAAALQAPAPQAPQSLPAGSPGPEAAARQAPAPQPAAAMAPQMAPVQARPQIDESIPVAPKVGNRAPDFTLKGIDGQTYKLSDLLGRPLVINYWATWCVPCKAELPVLQRISQEYAAQGVVILTIDAIEQDSVDKVQAMVSEMGLTFPVLLDEGTQFSKPYDAIFFPTTFFVDRNGVIRNINLGDANEEKFRSAIDQLMAGGF